MLNLDAQQLEIFLLEDTVWIATAPTGLPVYDFAFQTFFSCRHPWQRPDHISAIGRFGVTTNYADLYQSLEEEGVFLIHTPEQYLLASELVCWYPLLEDLTPQSIWFAEPPKIEKILEQLDFPIFLKGSRQTSRHKAGLSIVRSPEEYQQAIEHYKRNPILHWQQIVCREFIELRPVQAHKSTDVIPPSFEFRTFWWYGECVGAGIYWSEFASYSWNKQEEYEAVAVAQDAAHRLNLPFVVIDVAQTKDGAWIVIECNNGQESGYAGVPRIALWQRLLEAERMQNKTDAIF
jgi:hypothetical protein